MFVQWVAQFQERNVARYIVALVAAIIAFGCAEKKYLQTIGGGSPSEKPGQVCGPENRLETSQYCVSITWERYPTDSVSGSFLLKIWRPNAADNSPIVLEHGDSAAVELWMEMMGGGHGSNPVTVQKVDVGTYRATRVFFSMRGLWQIRVTVKSGGNEIDKVHIPHTF